MPSCLGCRPVQRVLTRHPMVGSMGRVGAAGDIAAMESFFSLLQKNVLNRLVWDTREELRSPRSSGPITAAALGRLTPVEFEVIMTIPADQAA